MAENKPELVLPTRCLHPPCRRWKVDSRGGTITGEVLDANAGSLN